MIKAVDTETTGFDSFNGDKPFAITTCDMDGKTEYISIGDDNLINICGFLLNENNEVVMHNAKFDIHMLYVYGMQTNAMVHDTMVAATIYNSDEDTVALKALAKKYLGVDNDEETLLKEYMAKHKIKTYDKVPREIMQPYAIQDARITLDLFKFYREKGVIDDPVYKAEMQLLTCLVSMERRGVLVDVQWADSQKETVEKRLEELQAIVDKDHKGINVRSSKQLAEYLFDDQGLRCDYRTPKGNPAFDEFNLSKYQHPLIPIIIEIREIGKLNNTYLKALKEKSDVNNVIHCSFNQVGARTGRFSCSQPNLQNIPRSAVVDIRKAFICREGFTNYYIDYSQIELRVLAHYSREPAMVDEYLKGRDKCDLHSLTCQSVFGEVTKEKRTLSKNINFGIIYGMGPKKFCEMVNEQFPDFEMTYQEARKYIQAYYKAYKAVRKFTWRVPQKILDEGFVTDVYGRKYTTPKGESYKGVNYLIQGCAAGIIKKAMIKVHKLLQDKQSNILLTIHDELVVEVHKDEEDLLMKIVELMEDVDTFRVPIFVNVERTTTDWSEKKAFVLSH